MALSSGRCRRVGGLLDEVAQVQVVGRIFALQLELLGFACNINRHDCVLGRQLNLKGCVDGLLGAGQPAHSAAADLQHVVQQLLAGQWD